MSREYNIKWTRSDYARLSHLVRKANQKIFEIEVKRPDISEYQPEYLDYQEIKSSIKSRKDLNRVMNKYNRYLRDGAEEVEKSTRGAVATIWEIKEFNINQRVENTKRTNKAKKLENMEVKTGGKSTGFKRGEMGSIKENAVKHSHKNFKNMSQKEWELASRLFEKKMQSTYDEEKKKQMLENYIKGLISEGYSTDLQELMNRIPLDKFMEIIDTDEFATFDFIYDPLELKAKEEQLFNIWERYADENVNNNINLSNISDTVENEYAQGLRIRGVGRL